MLPAYVISFILLFGGVGMPYVYILNCVGESTLPCRTLIFIVACFHFELLHSVNESYLLGLGFILPQPLNFTIIRILDRTI